MKYANLSKSQLLSKIEELEQKLVKTRSIDDNLLNGEKVFYRYEQKR